MTDSTETKTVRILKAYITNTFTQFGQFKTIQDFEAAKNLIFTLIQLEHLERAERCELRRFCDDIFYQETSENND